MSLIWMCHVTHMTESWHTYEWGMSHIWMSHVTHINEACHVREWGMSHIWMRHVTHVKESWHTYDWVIAHIWMSHVTHVNELCHTYEGNMAHIWMSRVTHMNVSCHNKQELWSCYMVTTRYAHIINIYIKKITHFPPQFPQTCHPFPPKSCWKLDTQVREQRHTATLCQTMQHTAK